MRLCRSIYRTNSGASGRTRSEHHTGGASKNMRGYPSVAAIDAALSALKAYGLDDVERNEVEICLAAGYSVDAMHDVRLRAALREILHRIEVFAQWGRNLPDGSDIEQAKEELERISREPVPFPASQG